MLIFVPDIPITGKDYDFILEERMLNLDIRLSEPAHFKGTAYRSGTDVRITGKVKTSLRVQCHRCLEPYLLPINADVELYYQPYPSIVQQEEEHISIEELGILHYKDNIIDLATAIRDLSLIHI